MAGNVKRNVENMTHDVASFPLVAYYTKRPLFMLLETVVWCIITAALHFSRNRFVLGVNRTIMKASALYWRQLINSSWYSLDQKSGPLKSHRRKVVQ